MAKNLSRAQARMVLLHLNGTRAAAASPETPTLRILLRLGILFPVSDAGFPCTDPRSMRRPRRTGLSAFGRQVAGALLADDVPLAPAAESGARVKEMVTV